MKVFCTHGLLQAQDLSEQKDLSLLFYATVFKEIVREMCMKHFLQTAWKLYKIFLYMVSGICFFLKKNGLH